MFTNSAASGSALGSSSSTSSAARNSACPECDRPQRVQADALRADEARQGQRARLGRFSARSSRLLLRSRVISTATRLGSWRCSTLFASGPEVLPHNCAGSLPRTQHSHRRLIRLLLSLFTIHVRGAVAAAVAVTIPFDLRPCIRSCSACSNCFLIIVTSVLSSIALVLASHAQPRGCTGTAVGRMKPHTTCPCTATTRGVCAPRQRRCQQPLLHIAQRPGSAHG